MSITWKLCARLAAFVVPLLAIILTAQTACAETAAANVADDRVVLQPTGLHTLDWAIIAVYALATIGMGLYFSLKQSSTDEYFVGSGNMNPFFVGVSLFATLLSTISYLSMPGESAGKGPVALVGLLALPLVYFVVAFWLIPVYMRQRVTSAYELLEARLGLSVRLLGATMFLVLRLVWMTLLIYLASKAMTVMMGIDFWIISLDGFSIQTATFKDALRPEELPGFLRIANGELRLAAIPVVVIFTGMVSVVYTTLGGMRAVVITDFMQTVLLFGGAILVLVMVTYDFGGFGWFPTQWQPNWDKQPIFSFDPKTRVTVIGTILTILTWYVATLGGDQTSVQRYMATRDAASARKVVATQLCVGTLVQFTLLLVGFALLGYFLAHPDHLRAGMDIKDNADDLFPRFVSYQLPVGVSGLVAAGMFAAAMSSVDSGVNSITAVVMTDYLDRFGLKPKTEKGHLRAAQLLALTIGVLVVLGSSYMKYIEGNITAVTSKTVNLLTTPVFALFFFALFVRRAKPLAVWIATFCGTATAAAIAFSGPLVYLLYSQFDIDPATFGVELIPKSDAATGRQWTTAEDPISFQWIGPIALAVNVCVGVSLSLLFSRRDPPDDDQTLKPRKKTPPSVNAQRVGE